MGEDGICSTLDGKQAALPQWLGLAVLCRVFKLGECAGPLCEHNLIHLLRLSIAATLVLCRSCIRTGSKASAPRARDSRLAIRSCALASKHKL